MNLEITVKLTEDEVWAIWQRNGAGQWEDSDGELAEPGMARALDGMEKAIALDPYTPKEYGQGRGGGELTAQRVRA